jgi:hypothetical protein
LKGTTSQYPRREGGVHYISYGVVTARAGAAEGVNTGVPSRVTAAGPQVTAAGPMFAAAAAPTARPVRGGDRMRNGSP